MPRTALAALGLLALALSPSALAQSDQCLFYDLNNDTLLDHEDVELFLPCVTGPNLGPPAFGCEELDSDSDGDIDQIDYGRFQACVGHSAAPVWPVISEFGASNEDGIEDDFGENSDWIEIYNPGPVPLRLKDWCLTDDDDELDKWRFPDVTVAPGGFLLVFASNRDRTDPGFPLHTSFKLEASGEFLALLTPDRSVAYAYSPEFLPQVQDVSFGLAMTAETTPLILPGADCRVLIPTVDIGLDWTGTAYNEAGWTVGKTGVGYEAGSGYESLILTNVIGMRNRMQSCYIRIPFLVNDPSSFNSLLLRMKYDDGFMAYLNGQPVAWANDQDPLNWNSGASQDHPDDQSLVYQDFDLSDYLGALHEGTNILAIHGLNRGAGSSDFLIVPELHAGSVTLLEPWSDRYFLSPTPGGPNVGGSSTLGPIMTDPGHTPELPGNDDILYVTVRVTPSFNPINSVVMTYRIMYFPELTVNMFDDGTRGDQVAGDGYYTGRVPADASNPGQMIRYRFTATDDQGNSSRWPLFEEPLNSPEYFGTVVANPAVSSQLPILQWFVQTPSLADTEAGTRCSLFFNGEFYDNVEVHIRGNTSSGWPKHNFKFDFNPGNHFRFDPEESRAEEMNLNSTYSDKSYIRQVLSSECYRDAGVVTSIAFPMRVQQNGNFYSVAVFVEEPDDDYLDRHGLDERGTLYKMFNQLESTSGAEKRLPQDGNFSDLLALVNGLKLTGDVRKRYLFDNIDIPACINYIAATTIMHDNDHVQKNYYLYRDSNDTLEWRFLPWDKDLTWGRNFGAGGGVLSDGIWSANDPFSHPLFGDSAHRKVDNLWNRLIDALHATPEIQAMYVRRLRTLMDEQLQPPGTPAGELLLEARIDELSAQLMADTSLDFTKWPQYGQSQTFTTAVNVMKTQYLAVRRTHLFNTHSTPGGGIIPGLQPADALLQLGAIEHSPASGIQDEEYIQIVNPNTYAVDMTGWKLAVNSKIKHRFHAGTVILGTSFSPRNVLYATPRAAVFRARASSPKGNEMHQVQGNYDNHLVPGETVELIDPNDVVVASVLLQ